jgi:cation transporter-like permease
MVSIFLAAILVKNWSMPDLSLAIIVLLGIKETFPSRYRFFGIFLQSSPVVVICGLLGIIAGLFLHYHQQDFGAAPYLLVLLPQLISKIGSIGSISGMRLTSALYIGYARPFAWNKYVWLNLLAALLLSLILVLPVAVISHITAQVFNIGNPVLSILLILTFVGMVPLSFGASLFSFVVASISKRIHLDPSNVVAPLITSASDATGIFLFILLVQLFT